MLTPGGHGHGDVKISGAARSTGASRASLSPTMLFPIRTEMLVRRTPLANYAIIAANCLTFVVFNWMNNASLIALRNDHLVLASDWPSLYQFFTYQFLHAGPVHLAGNMLFLWVFGNSVNAKMGDWPYVFFYLASGVFSGFVFALTQTAHLLGASGAIAGITTAYLVLFPRSRVTVMYMLFFIGFFEVPAMILIGLKIILWDNIVAPGIYGAGNVATEAHLGGYFFGLVGAGLMLLVRAIPRDHFDLLALLDRWNRRRAFQATLADPEARRRAQFGTAARPAPSSETLQRTEEARMDRISELRSRIADCLARSDAASAATLYEQLVDLDARQCLPAREQLAVAREFYASNRFPQAVAAFERYLTNYPDGVENDEIGLLLGIVYARELQQYSKAEEYLVKSLPRLKEAPRREQCARWLADVRQLLGKPTFDA